MSSTGKTLSTRVKERLREFGVQEGDLLYIAYSGGPDSTALLYIAATLRKKAGIRVRALFVDHGIRPAGERAAEHALVIRTAHRLEVPLMSLCLPGGMIAGLAKLHGGMEAAARAARYSFFEETAEAGEGFVLLAHTLDDQMETQIMRFFQGSGPEGLAGIPERRGPFLRPLLSVTKEELYRYLDETGAEYSTDSTNRTENYLRNRVRNELMPAARAVFPGMERALGELAEKMRSSGDAEGDRGPDFRLEKSGEVSFDADAFAAATDGQRRRLMYRLWDYLHEEDPRRLPHRFLRNFFRSFDDMYNEAPPEKSEAKRSVPVVEKSVPEAEKHKRDAAGVLVAEGHGLRVELKGRRIFCRTNVVREQKKSYLTKIEEGVVETGSGTRIFVQHGTLDQSGAESGESVALCSSREFAPCVLRSRREGDSIQLAGGKLKLKELMGRLRIPSDERWRYPVVEDRRGILALLDPADLSSSVMSVPAGEMPVNGFRIRIREARSEEQFSF